jgi:methionyl-tRNA formyltransferase
LGLIDEDLHVACGQGVLAIGQLQLEGRRMLTAAEFSRGQSLAGVRFD